MLRLLADENFNHHIVNATRARDSTLDFLTIQDAGLRTTDDDVILAWAAEHGYVVVTHDYATMPEEAWARVGASLPMPGVILVASTAKAGMAARELAEFAVAGREDDLQNTVTFIRA